ncbi:RNase H domain-containing protein [Trichonephila clavipes]|nr:RNase H domain-containing protein [Trichonephila clavipes]
MWRERLKTHIPGDRRYKFGLLSFLVKNIFTTSALQFDVCGNEIADGLAREGSHKDSKPGSYLVFFRNFHTSQKRCQLLLEATPVHEWYERNHPGAALLETDSRRDETTLAAFRSGHTRAQRHVAGLKVYPSCPNCNVIQTAPAHILACIGCHKSQLLSSPATVLQCLKTHGFMNLI